MEIAIVGSGIAGLMSAYLLSKKHKVTLFESADQIGGHTRTLEVDINDTKLNIDVGFIVFNKQTYPNFCQFLNNEKIPYEPTEMSFSYCDPALDFEYNGHTLISLFAQKQNFMSLKFHRMLYDIIKFNLLAKNKKFTSQDTLETFLARKSFGKLFKDAYILPMTQAIWSSPMDIVTEFPVSFLFNFLENHGLLNIVNRPTWYVVSGGSSQYVSVLLDKINAKVDLDMKITKIERTEKEVMVHHKKGTQRFDKVIIATHADQALEMLDVPSLQEKEVLSSIGFSQNSIVLHTDKSLLPKRRAAWASWNFRKNDENKCCVTYYMNRLQNLDSKVDICVSLNQDGNIDSNKIVHKLSFSHPILDFSAVKAQKQLPKINGRQNTYFCGAYWQNGFHEDGVNSAINVARMLGELT